jgi:uncharacterized protein YeaO (DUF488 family)
MGSNGGGFEMIRIKRAYDAAQPQDGARYLVDRLWPRGRRKEDLDLVAWPKEVAPSDNLRKWFGHDPQKWGEFRRLYFSELDQNPAAWRSILERAREGRVTLVYAAKDEEHNNAVALKEYLETRSQG